MAGQLQRMLSGELYRDNDPELVAMRRACGRLLDRFNATAADDDGVRRTILTELLGGIGESSWIMPLPMRLRLEHHDRREQLPQL